MNSHHIKLRSGKYLTNYTKGPTSNSVIMGKSTGKKQKKNSKRVVQPVPFNINNSSSPEGIAQHPVASTHNIASDQFDASRNQQYSTPKSAESMVPITTSNLVQSNLTQNNVVTQSNYTLPLNYRPPYTVEGGLPILDESISARRSSVVYLGPPEINDYLEGSRRSSMPQQNIPQGNVINRVSGITHNATVAPISSQVTYAHSNYNYINPCGVIHESASLPPTLPYTTLNPSVTPCVTTNSYVMSNCNYQNRVPSYSVSNNYQSCNETQVRNYPYGREQINYHHQPHVTYHANFNLNRGIVQSTPYNHQVMGVTQHSHGINNLQNSTNGQEQVVIQNQSSCSQNYPPINNNNCPPSTQQLLMNNSQLPYIGGVGNSYNNNSWCINSNRSQYRSEYLVQQPPGTIDAIRKVRSWQLTFPSQNLDPEEFLFKLERKMLAEGLPAEVGLVILPEVLTGEALAWYACNYQSWSTWFEFLSNFNNVYVKPKTEREILNEIHQATCKNDESPIQLALRVQKLYNKLISPPPIFEQLSTIVDALPMIWTLHLRTRPINSYNDLYSTINQLENVVKKQMARKRTKQEIPSTPLPKGRVKNKVFAIQEEEEDTEEETDESVEADERSDAEEDHVKEEPLQQLTLKKEKLVKSDIKTKINSKRPTPKSTSTKTKSKVNISSEAINKLVETVDQLTKWYVEDKEKRAKWEKQDKTKMKCFRCHEMGHTATTCKAKEPITNSLEPEELKNE